MARGVLRPVDRTAGPARERADAGPAPTARPRLGRHPAPAGLALVLALAGVAVGAYLLLRIEVPSLELPRVEPAEVLTQPELERIEDYRRLPRWLWVGSAILQLGALGLLAWRARPLASRLGAGRRFRTGVGLGLLASAAVWLAALPTGVTGHWWRRKHGLSVQGYWAWLGDSAIGFAVTSVVVALVVAIALVLAARWRRRWWIPGGLAVAGLGVVYLAVAPLAIEPLFNRFEPLRDPVLAARIEAAGERLGVEIGEVDVVDASRRTTAANAVVTGLGPTKRIALYDTLLDGRFSDDEVAFVAAHELAHVERSHTWKGAAWFALFAIPGVATIGLVTNRRGGLHDPALVPLALLCALALSLATLPAQNALSRRYEGEADWLALVATQDPAGAAGLFRGLAVASLGDPDPPAWSRIVLSTHPTLLDRVAMTRAFAEAGAGGAAGSAAGRGP